MDSDVISFMSSLLSFKEARDCRVRIAEIDGEPDIPNSAEPNEDFSAAIGFLGNVSEIGQTMSIAEAIFDQIGYNRTIAEIEKAPGEYFGNYKDTLGIDAKVNSGFAERVATAAQRVKSTKSNAVWQNGNDNSLSMQLRELATMLRFDGAML